MSPDQLEDDQVDDVNTGEEAGAEDEAPKELDLEVQVASPSACERHVTVTISRGDIDRYLDDAFGEMMASAAVPGFRAGRAPRKVVEGRYRQEVTDQIKGSLLMDSLTQISGEQEFTAIGEPDLDLNAVEIPKDGPMTFEFTIEVRPEFDMPKWKGLKLRRPTREFTDEDIDQHLEQILSRYGQLAPFDGAVSTGDYLTADISTRDADGKLIEESKEEVFRVRPTLSFVDCELEGFEKLVEGAKAGDKRSAEIEIMQDAPNEELRGQKLTVEFNILEVKKLKLPELTDDFLQEIGGFDSEADLRDTTRDTLERQLDHRQQQLARQQITSLLTESANWDLPPGLLERQGSRELERATMELRRSGFSEAEIRARENQLRQNSAASTATALKEHFILERIAEDEGIDIEDGDYEKEVMLMAMQSGESPRRVRAQLEKRGLMDVLRNQIIERKVLECVQEAAKFEDEPYEPTKTETEAIHLAAGGSSAAIADATEADDAEEKS